MFFKALCVKIFIKIEGKSANTMLNIYILDDNSLFCTRLKRKIELLASDNPDFIITKLELVDRDFVPFVSGLSEKSFNNVYLVDISLNGELNGLALSKKIRAHDLYGYIIIISSHIEYLTSAFSYNIRAINFLDKFNPNFNELLANSFNEIIREINQHNLEIPLQSQNNTYVLLTGKSKLLRIDIEKLVYIETKANTRNTLVFSMIDFTTREFRSSIKDFLSTPDLPDYIDVAHKSFIINYHKVCGLEYINNLAYAVFTNGMKCNVSRKYIRKVKQYVYQNSNCSRD